MRKITTLLILLTCNYIAYAETVDKSRLLTLLRQTEFYILAENYERAAELRDQSMAMFKCLGAGNDQNTIAELHKISHAYYEKKMFSEAVKTESLLVEVYPRAIHDNINDYALYLNDLSLYLLEDHNIDLAEKYIKKALSLIKNINDVKIAFVYIRAAEVYKRMSPPQIDLSIKYQKIAVNLYANAYGKTNSTYLEELFYLAKYYELAEDYYNAYNAYREIIYVSAEDKKLENTQSLLPILDRIIFCCRKTNNTKLEKQYKKIAFSIKSHGIEFHEAKYKSPRFPSLKDSLDYVAISEKMDSYRKQLNQLEENSTEINHEYLQEEANHYLATLPDSYGKAYFLSIAIIKESCLGDWKTVIEYGTDALRIFDNLGIITNTYVDVLCLVADAYGQLDNPAKEYDYLLKAYELRDDYLSFYDDNYYKIPNYLAQNCRKIGNYIDAIKYVSMSIKDLEPTIYSDNPYRYFESLDILASIYGNIGQYDNQLEVLQYLVNKAAEEENLKNLIEFPEMPYLYNFAWCLLLNGYYDQAIENGLKIKEVREKHGSKSHLSSIYCLLANAYLKHGKMDEALRYANEANEIQKNIGKDDGILSSNTYHTLAEIYKYMGNFKEAEKMERESIKATYNNIMNNFMNLSSVDRTSYWIRYYEKFIIDYPNYFYMSPFKDASELYNKSALFTKGLLLSIDTEMTKLISESGDEKALAKYRKLLSCRAALSKTTLNEDTKTNVSIDLLRTEIEKIERELIKECKEYGDYTSNLRTTWKEVQAALKPNDMAIEFLAFPVYDINDGISNHDTLIKILYVALILRKDDKAPLFVELFDETELDKIEEQNNVYSEKLYNLIWQPIDKYLLGIDNVYFSPSRKLYSINIEVLPEIVGNNKNYYRVSSTRQLVRPNETSSVTREKAIIYGGIKYDTSISELIADSKLYSQKNHSFRGKVDDLDLRYGWDYLPETLTETNEIVSILNKNDFLVQVYTDTLATESSFKFLDGQSCKIVHIATHGFYYSESDSIKMQKNHFDIMTNQLNQYSRSYQEDYSMTRSGLLMAGCNNILRGYKLPDDIDDGILFAKEIAGINLKNVELVTLSSCDSGLGDVMTGEGVFGLQRAFKKAGANTILMSLNKVDDEATKILMVEFYRNLMNGKTKYQSLKEAQQYLRKVDNGKYDDPKYWASFIMLDGLN